MSSADLNGTARFANILQAVSAPGRTLENRRCILSQVFSELKTLKRQYIHGYCKGKNEERIFHRGFFFCKGYHMYTLFCCIGIA